MAQKGSVIFSMTFLIILNIIFWCYTTTGEILKENDSEATENYYNTALSISSSERCQHMYGNLTSQEMARCEYVPKRVVDKPNPYITILHNPTVFN